MGIPNDQLGLLDGKWKSGHELYHITLTTVDSHVSAHGHVKNTLQFDST